MFNASSISIKFIVCFTNIILININRLYNIIHLKGFKYVKLYMKKLPKLFVANFIIKSLMEICFFHF